MILPQIIVMSIVTLFYNRHIRAFSNACANVRYQALLSLPPPPFESLDSRLILIRLSLRGIYKVGFPLPMANDAFTLLLCFAKTMS